MLLAMAHIAKAQPGPRAASGSLSGVVKEANGQPVANGTVSLYRAKDSSLITGTITDDGGHYHFASLSPGRYIVAASGVGMTRVFSLPVAMGETGAVRVPDLVLRASLNLLKGISVSAQKPSIEYQLDKTVINVENSPAAAGNTALELLQNAPGVTVDQDGHISLKGKPGVTILIDGKPTHLSETQVTDMLRSMSADQLSKIELISNPSAKYDAAGTAGIIDLKLKKNSMEGLNGNATLGFSQGFHGNYNGGFNMNYKKGKINLFGSYNLNQNTQKSTFNLIRRFYHGGDKLPDASMEQHSPRKSTSTYRAFKVGMDYAVDKKNTIGIQANGDFSRQNSHSSGPIRFYSSDRQLDSLVSPVSDIRETWNSVGYSLNYKLVIDTGGQELTANVDYSTFTSGMHQHYQTGYEDGNGNQLRDARFRQGNLPSAITIKSGKIDYTLPVKGGAKLEMGLKASQVVSDNNVRYENREGGHWENDSGATNHFIYRENINAGYINLNKSFKGGWALQAGLRGEQTLSKANQVTIDSVVNRQYFRLFPSVFVNKDLGKNNRLGFSFSRRIDRPDYESLNPFTYYIDDYTYTEGNPFLEPQFTNSFELSHTYKSLITTTLGFSRTTDVITNVILQNDTTHAAFETKENINSRNNFNLSVSAPIQITKWWMSNNNASVFRNNYKGSLNEGELDLSKTSFGINTTNTFTLPGDVKLELRGYYRSAAVYGVWVSAPQYSVSAGIQKAFWDKKALLKVSVNDIFNTQEGRSRLKYQNIDLRLLNTWESRRVAVTFTYNFGNRNMKSSNQHKTGIEEEQNRINKGG